MTQQEMVERDLRMLIGDLNIQLIFARSRIIELEEQVAGVNAQLMARPKAANDVESVEVKPNGSGKPSIISEVPPTT